MTRDQHHPDVIGAAFTAALMGEGLPSFRSPDVAGLLAVVTEAAGQRLLCETVGRRVLSLLLDQMSASMQTEREVSIMRKGNAL
ncbi:MAG TPA: hypothetical protein VMS38_03635 [Pseudorhodoferax sp.]|nr:hypothetical protein [Pseudorhodoferax sp.]